MTAQHGRTPPDDCAQCRKVFAFLHTHHQDAPDVPPTAARLAEVCGIGPRMVLVHVAHLVHYRRLQDDRRTPVPGAMVGREMPPEDPSEITPRAWAANADVHGCGTCAAILGVLARESKGTWRGQVTTEHLAAETAKALGKRKPLDARTVRLHLRAGHRESRIGHSLVGWRLVAFETADGEITGKDQHGRPMYVRRPDRFILWPSQARKSGPPRWSPYTAEGAAARLLGKTSWFDPSRPQAGWVVRLVAGLLERDCPEAEITARLDVVPRTSAPLASQYRFARRRLVPLLERKTPWTRPAPETAAPVVPVAPARTPECPRCGKPSMWQGRPHHCTEPPLPGTAVPTAPPRQCHQCHKNLTNSPVPFYCDGCGADQRVSA